VTRPFAYRDPDGDIDLDRALGQHLVHYVGVMVSGAADIRPEAFRPEAGAPLEGTLVRFAYGRPAQASSCGTLAVQPEFSWDVCAYYLILGVSWRATRGEIRRAYVARCARPDGQVQEERLTYVTAQLSYPEVRRAYDMTPLGGVFLRDREVAAAIRRKAAAEAGRRMSEGEDITADEVMSEMGFQAVPRGQGREDGEEPAGRPAQPRTSRWAVQWGHYAVAGPQGIQRPDAAVLEAWQGMVAAALRERGVTAGFAVAQGYGDSPMVLRDINESCIVFVTGERASPEKAQEAVKMGVSLGYVTGNQPGGI
jgi:hypothetical protein